MSEAKSASSSAPEGGMCCWYNSRRRSFLRRLSSYEGMTVAAAWSAGRVNWA
jgi:hypothetical protein